ncbi:MAG TPA: hypothetical protein HA346_06235 [Thermoplasmata archaeon]|nr:hypothetical protein [Thermoplasmata archaeon]
MTWLGNIYAAQCGFLASACDSYSPTVCISGMATTWFNFCGSICQGTSPFFMVQCLFTRVLNLQQNVIVGCCGCQWLTPCFDTLNNCLANPFGCCLATPCTQELPIPVTLPIIPEAPPA